MRVVVALVVLCAVSFASPARAQSAASSGLRETISAKLQELVTAANSGDADAFFALTGGSSELMLVGDGRIMRGQDEIRANLKDLFVEHERYRFVLGTTDVVTAGSGVAIAVAPYQFTAVGDEAAVQLTGAFTVVFARNWFWQDWKVVHSHRSTGKIGVAIAD
jgi:ketosteroid isomerase-like protein